MDLNHRSPGYEPDGISRLPHLANSSALVHQFETTDGKENQNIAIGFIYVHELPCTWAGEQQD